jgi:regulatory protein
LARREHSAAELRGKLERAGFPAAELEQVLRELVGEGLLDDGRFAEAFVRYRCAAGNGPERIRQELRQRGVATELIDGRLDAADPAWLDQAAAARRKRFGPDPPEDYRAWAQQARFLQYRGFTSEQIRAVLRADRSE